MKTYIKGLIYIFLICLLTSSCHDEVCDFEISQGIYRSDMVKMNLESQRILFRELSPEVKAQLYRYKLSYDLKTCNLSRQEKKVLREIMYYVTPETYYSTADSSEKELYFVSKLNALGWDDDKIFKHTMIIMTVEEFDNGVHVK